MQKLRYSSLLYHEIMFILLSEFASRVTPTRSLSEVWSGLLLYFHRVWLVSALTSSRVMSRCILGFQATSFTHATTTRPGYATCDRLFAIFLWSLVNVCVDVIQSDVRSVFGFLTTALRLMTIVVNDWITMHDALLCFIHKAWRV